MSIQVTRHAFIPWNPHLSEGEDLDCSICRESLPETPETSSQIAIKHTGPDGEKHPSTHLGCLITWLEKRDLCMLCNHPLDKEQLSLFLEELESLDFPSLSFEELTSIALEARLDLTTREGCCKRASKILNKAIQTIEAAFLHFTTCSTRYETLLGEKIKHLEDKLVASTEEEYLLAKERFASIPRSILTECKENYNAAISTLREIRSSYRESSKIYVLNEGAMYISRAALTALEQSPYPLLQCSNTTLLEKANQLKLSEAHYYETVVRIEELNRKFSTIEHSVDLKLELLSSTLLCLFLYTKIREFTSYKRDSATAICLDEFRDLLFASALACMIIIIFERSLKETQNYQDLKNQINDLLICKIKFPLKNAYQTLTAFSELIKEDS